MRLEQLKCDSCGEALETGVEVDEYGRGGPPPIGWISMRAAQAREIPREPDPRLPRPPPPSLALVERVTERLVGDDPEVLEAIRAEHAASAELAAAEAARAAAEAARPDPAVNVQITADFCPTCIAVRPLEVVAALSSRFDAAAEKVNMGIFVGPSRRL